MLRLFSAVIVFAACTPADTRTLELDGPETVVVDHFGPVRGPSPKLSDGSVPDTVSITVTPPEIGKVEGIVVSAESAGEAQIELDWKGQKASWTLKVEPKVVLRVVDPPTYLRVGERQPLHLEAMVGGRASDPGDVTWTSSAPQYATVAASGEVQAVAPGTVYIIAKSGESEAMVELVVQP
ncbi:MAG: hypothetical protein EA397_15095 [Deltaproteobacteria bacterium]|nr:MAG: hypothetical protein EA397_15095 [Deltaproteobacteria bacterium]